MAQNAPSPISPVEAPRPPRRPLYVVRGRPGREDRGPLPSGHALSWDAITAGTVLDQAQYPYPVFPR